ncbi:MAG: hypothetical protein WC866_00475 [Patescibacteria group bacterium]|jgi:hypothetical protein
MRTHFWYLVLLFTLAACAARPARVRSAKPSPHDTPRTLPIWIEDDPRMPKEAVMRGCQKWKAKNITCIEVLAPEDSKIQIYADDGICVERDEKGAVTRRTLAWAFYGGRVTMMANCLTKTLDGAFDPHQLSAVVTHEVGHQLGIWDHVPGSCTEEGIAIHEETGRGICGVAVMNKYYNPRVSIVTVVDAMAFDERNPEFSLAISDMKDIPICTYHESAP